MNTFIHGTATLISVDGRACTVRCPHCAGEHTHRRDSLGSREVLAICSTPDRPRTYELPPQNTRRK
ncbi:hypothetical protein [Mycolicibacterium sp. CR10]|uniref:hypothetical protein n=1 Tax=Mycolicibacterium sp. CR10 TaxID=2562314 RepID=UPI0010C017EA|nr:hypothetical protein [Mycolicibacterium sp. CR10]